MHKRKPHPASVRKTQTATVKDVVDAMLKSYNIEGRFDQTKIISAWPRIMGQAIANRTESVEVRRDVIIVTLKSAPLKQELNASKDKVIEMINKEFGKVVVKEVLFV